MANRGTRYIEVPRADMMDLLFIHIGGPVVERGGSVTESVQGREVVVDIRPPNRQAVVRVYTTLSRGAEQVRDCGADAIRLVVGAEVDGPKGRRFRPLARSRKMLRTAPKGDDDYRLAQFLDRLRTAIREAYGEALRHPTCPKCGRLMGLREPKNSQKFQPFYGCTGYPECRSSLPFEGSAKNPTAA